MELKISKSAIYHYFIIYILLLFQGGVIFKPFLDYFTIGAILLSGWFVFKRKLLKGFIDKTLIFIIMLGIILLLTNFVSRGSLSIYSVLFIISNFMLVYFVYHYNKVKFCHRLVKIVVFMSFVSLIYYISSLFYLDLIKSILIKLTYEGSTFYWSPFFSILDRDSSRNIGIYGEPGLHQIVANVVLYLLLFYDEKELLLKSNVRIRYIIVMLLTIGTIQSTTGYITAMVLLIGYTLQKKDIQKRKIKKLFFLISIMMIMVISYQGTDNFLEKSFLNKIMNSDGNIDLNVSTGRSRTVSMDADIHLALDYPLGAGFEVYNKEWRNYLTEWIPDSASPVGLTKSLATIGIVATSMILWFYMHFAWKNRKSLIAYIVYLFMIINTSLSQPLFWYPIFIIVSLIVVNRVMEGKRLVV